MSRSTEPTGCCAQAQPATEPRQPHSHWCIRLWRAPCVGMEWAGGGAAVKHKAGPRLGASCIRVSKPRPSISQSPGARLHQHTGRALRAPCWHRLGHRRPEERTSALTTHSAAVAEALLLHSGHRTHPHRGRLVPGDHRQPAPDRTLVADLAPGLPRPSEAVRPTSRSARAFP